jgi:tetratricopeptide (TPR) repeat protein
MEPWGSPIDSSEVRLALRAVLNSAGFRTAPRLREFLSFVTEETLAGRSSLLKEHTIGVQVYRRPLDYDPKTDAIVRVEAIRLRQKLADYYEGEGRRDPVVIRLDKGSYEPKFERRNDPLHSDEVEYLLAKGWHLTHSLQPEGLLSAQIYARRALAAAPHSPEAHAALAHFLVMPAGLDLTEALDHGLEALRVTHAGAAMAPDHSDLHVCLGMLLPLSGDLDGGYAAARRSVELAPENWQAHYWISFSLLLSGKADASLAHYRICAGLRSSCFVTRLSPSRFLYHLGDFRRGRDIGREMTEWEPNCWMPYYWWGMNALFTQDKDEAVAALERSVQLSNASLAKAALGCAYVRTGQRERAETLLEEMYRDRAETYVAPSSLAIIHHELGQPELAAPLAVEGFLSMEPKLALCHIDPLYGPLLGLASRLQPR